MLAPLVILGAAALVIVIAFGSYRRRAGVVSGAGRGAPASPLVAIVLSVLVVVGAGLIFVMVQP